MAAGDIDNDGFPDLYVGNVGQNRLYHNNGDGTFSLVAHHQDTRIIWTTSVMIADVNGDTWPDIFDVNYVTGEDVFTRHCVDRRAIRDPAAPGLFDGELDSLFLNAGDGTWRDVSEASGVSRTQSGRGMGIVAADFDAAGDLELYIANDVMENFLWVRQSGVVRSVILSSPIKRLSSGVACDGSGRPQAAMGIACDDINGDGLLDMLVGNYYNDSNTLYIQQPGRFFVDATRRIWPARTHVPRADIRLSVPGRRSGRVARPGHCQRARGRSRVPRRTVAHAAAVFPQSGRDRASSSCRGKTRAASSTRSYSVAAWLWSTGIATAARTWSCRTLPTWRPWPRT